jgi:hypothetical protein
MLRLLGANPKSSPRPWAAGRCRSGAGAVLSAGDPGAAQKLLREARLRHLGQVRQRGLEVGLGIALVGQLAGEAISIGLW